MRPSPKIKFPSSSVVAIVSVFGAIIASSTLAGPRSSASYSVATDTTDAGGRRTTSANYTNDGSAGGIAGISTVAAPAETAKAGYLGQLYEAMGLQVAAAPTTVGEGATRQLGGVQLLDDLTTIAVPATSVTWSVQNGPLTGVSAGGLATAATVFQDTAATVQGIFAGQTGTLNLTVVNTLLDNFGSYAADGLDDAWQSQFFGLNNPNAAPTADPDSDGANNGAEFNALTNPTSGASFFVATSSVSGANLIISFLTVTGRTYTLQRSDDLAPGSWITTGLPAPLAGTDAIRTFIVPLPITARRFLRVQVGP